MKIRQKPADYLELESRIDEEIGLAWTGRDATGTLARGILQRSHRRGAHGNNPAIALQRAVDLLHRLRRNSKGFTMHFVLFNFLYPHWLKCAQAHVQSDLRNFNSALANVGENFRGKVQSRC